MPAAITAGATYLRKICTDHPYQPL